MMKFVDLNQAAFVEITWHPHDRTEGRGRNVAFVFNDLTPEHAAALFASPEFEMCCRFRRAWIGVRRAIEQVNTEAAP
jgi:hypothetical protein